MISKVEQGKHKMNMEYDTRSALNMKGHLRRTENSTGWGFLMAKSGTTAHKNKAMHYNSYQYK